MFIDNGTIADYVQRTEGFNKVLETKGVSTLTDQLQWVREGGAASMVGSVSGKWAIGSEFDPKVWIPTVVNLTAYHSRTKAFKRPFWVSLLAGLGKKESGA